MKILAFAASNNPQSINQQLALSVVRLLPQAAKQAAPFMGAKLASAVSVQNFHQVFGQQYQQVKHTALFLQLQHAALTLHQPVMQSKAA